MAATQTATFLFTDLVGSTAIATSMPPAAADLLRQEHFSVLRGALEATGGVEVQNLGDGIMAVYPSCSQALDGAVAMQQACLAANRRREVPEAPDAAGGADGAADGRAPALSIRIGVATGEATLEEGDYFGDPVVEAARLCSAADGGQILATALVGAMLGRRREHPLRSLGEKELKGLPEPIEVLEVGWEPAPATERVTSGVPLPARLASAPPTGFVGRSEQAEALDRAWKDVSAGAARTVLVSGEAGIGKTRLARELVVRAHEAGAMVLLGPCDEAIEAPYRPWIEALGHLVRYAPDPVLATVGPARMAELSRVLPEARDRIGTAELPTSTDPETERYQLFSAVISLLAAASRVAPVVLVLDDLHWADPTSLVLLRHVVTAGGSPGLLIIGTYRDAEVGVDHPLADALAALRREPGVERMGLSGLSDDEVLALVEEAAGADTGESGAEFAQALYRETDGNPFFAWEVMRHLAESGWAVRGSDGQWGPASEVAVELPESVKEVIGRRVVRLGEAASRLLSTAAVIGAEFELPVLAETAAEAADRVLDDLERAERAGLVRSTAAGRFRFTHAIIRHTLYEALGPTRRALAHAQVADVLERLGWADERPEELARHWAAAVGPTERTKAIDYGRRAGDHALASLAPEQAAAHYRRVLEILDPAQADLRVELECSLAEAMCQAGDPAFRELALTAGEEADRLGRTDLLVQACLTEYQFSSTFHHPERMRLIERALDRVGPTDSEDRVRLLAALADEMAYSETGQRLDIRDEAVALARRIGDPRLLMGTLVSGMSGTFLSYWREAVEEALALAEQLGDQPSLARCYGHRWFTALTHAEGGLAAAEQWLDLSDRTASRTGRPDLIWSAMTNRVEHLLHGGRLEDAEATATEALEYGQRTGQPGALVRYVAQLFCIRWHQGRPEEVEEVTRRAADTDEVNLDLLRLAMTGTPEGEDLEAAIRSLRVDPAWLQTATLVGERAARSGQAGAIAAMYEQLLPFGRLYAVQSPSRGPVGLQMALLSAADGRTDDAARWFEEAARVNAVIGAPFHTARTNIEWARYLLASASGRSTDADLARRLLNEAGEISTRLGYPALERRAERLLSGTDGDGA